MRISIAREGSRARLGLEGRLDREWSEHLSGALERLLQEGVRSVQLDLAGVTYVSSAATRVLSRWHEELSMLRGDMELAELSPGVRDALAVIGWESAQALSRRRSTEPRRSSWHARADFTTSGQYELSTIALDGQLTCRLQGDPGRLTRAQYGPEDCEAVAFPERSFGLGLGAIGGSYDECRAHFGELVAIGGCIASFPSGGARMADYIIGGGGAAIAPRAVLASGLRCEGEFSHLMRFSPRPETGGIPLSEVAEIALDAVGGNVAGLVIAAEAAGLSGVRLLRSPADGDAPVRFEVPMVRDWLLFAPERTHAMSTALIVGVVARTPSRPLAEHLRPLGDSVRLLGHFHAAVFSYLPLPQRTVELAPLVRGRFAEQQLRDVLHLIRDPRGDSGVPESELIRGVAWAGPVAEIT